jgi:hypothetical protein
VNEDRPQVALPKLYGAPAYARPPVAAARPVDRPFDPDELPLESERSDEERELVQRLQPHPYEAVARSDALPSGGRSKLRARAFRLRLPGRG